MSSITSWGPKAWGLLHTCSFTYPVNPTWEDRYHNFNFLKSFAEVIPCMKCKKHFKETLSTLSGPSDRMFDSREAYSRWLVDIHNEVNQRLGKKLRDYDDVRTEYEDTSAVCSVIYQSDATRVPQPSHTTLYICAIACLTLVIVIMFAFIMKNKKSRHASRTSSKH